jgi:hypothetical protein
MEESTQQLIALGLVVVIIAAELIRRRRKKKQSSSGCGDCGSADKTADKKESPLKFYRRR